MIYDYICNECQHKWDVIKSASQIDDIEACPNCQKTNNRRIITGGSGFLYAGDWDKAQYNPAFGCMVKNRRHRAELAKQFGVEEIGNEPINKIHDTIDKEREKKLEARREKACIEAAKALS